MVALGYRFILLLPATGGSALPGAPFRLSTPHQARVETPLPEVHPPGDSGTDLLCPADAQHLCKNNVGKYEESLGVPTPTQSQKYEHVPSTRHHSLSCGQLSAFTSGFKTMYLPTVSFVSFCHTFMGIFYQTRHDSSL